MQEAFRNKSGSFSPAFADPTVMIVNTNLEGENKITGFASLLDPELKGKIAFGDPVNSSSAFQSLMAMLYAMGKDNDPLSDEAWRLSTSSCLTWTESFATAPARYIRAWPAASMSSGSPGRIPP